MTRKMKPIAWKRSRGVYAMQWTYDKWTISRYDTGRVDLSHWDNWCPFNTVTEAMQAVAKRVWGGEQ